jgi:hypothetical protein
MRVLVLAVLLAGCGSTQVTPQRSNDARPTRVVLYEDTVTVETTDRFLCTGPRDGRPRDWSGTLQGCAHPWPYRATLPGYRVARLPLAQGEGGAGRVEIATPSGTLVFSGPR